MSKAIELGSVNVSVDENGVASIEFFHPLSNSLPSKLLRKLADAIESAGKNDEVKVILLKSGGERAFCAGASFDELLSINDLAVGKAFFSGFAHVINAIRTAPKFVVCRVHGKAVGGGVGIAAAADYTFGTESAAVKLSELAIGIGPFVVGPAVERKIGGAAFSQMTINATNWYAADWACERGLFSSVHKSVNEMDAAIDTLLNKLSISNPEAMKLLKEVFWEGTEDWNNLLDQRAELSGRLVLSEFTRNAISKFKKGN